MSDYTPVNDFSAKDSLTTGDPEKIILGSDVDAETDAIATAVATKYDSSDLASQGQAEAGAVNTVLMTPLRVFQSAAAYLLTGRVVPDGALSTNVPLLNAANAFTTSQTITSAAPIFYFSETGVTANNGVWRVLVDGEAFFLTAVNDAINAETAFFSVQRTGLTIDSIALAATTITLNGVSAADYARLSVDNTFTSDVQTVKGTSTSAYPRWVVTNSAGGRKLELGYTGSAASPVYGESADTPWLNAQGGFTLSIADTAAFVLDSSRNFNFKAGTVTTNNASASEVGFKGTPANSQAGNYTLVLADAGKTILNSGSSAVNTIPANGSVAFPVGTVVTWINTSGGNQTIAITTNTLYLAGTASTGTRTLAAVGMATAVKISSTEWVISGAGLS